MMNDPKGFHNIVWGAGLDDKAGFGSRQGGPNINEYQLRNAPPSFAGIPVESVRFFSVDDQFARVTIRYHGEDRHKQILAYLEQEFGSIERFPGQMMRGLNQQYNWRGTETEINLTYQASTERGYHLPGQPDPGSSIQRSASPIRRSNMPRHLSPDFTGSVRACLIGVFCLLFCGTLAFAVPMQNDPKGFEGIPWGAAFSESETFTKVEDTGRAQTYELKTGPPSFGPAKVESMRFLTVDDKFARVTVRYQGKATHDQILAYLQSRYGSLDRTPGQIRRRGRQVFSWTGFESEMNLRYETGTDRGIIFFESQELRPKITEGNSPTVF